MIAVLYYASPNVKLRGFKWVTPGSLVAIVVWIVASALFAFYVSNFGSYNKTYGTLGGLIALLVWFWISNLAILFGHQLNAERERSLEIEEGRPRAEREIQLEPRDEPKPPEDHLTQPKEETMAPSPTDIPSRLMPLAEELLDNSYARENLQEGAEKLRDAYGRAQKRRVKPSKDRKLRASSRPRSRRSTRAPRRSPAAARSRSGPAARSSSALLGLAAAGAAAVLATERGPPQPGPRLGEGARRRDRRHARQRRRRRRGARHEVRLHPDQHRPRPDRRDRRPEDLREDLGPGRRPRAAEPANTANSPGRS